MGLEDNSLAARWFILGISCLSSEPMRRVEKRPSDLGWAFPPPPLRTQEAMSGHHGQIERFVMNETLHSPVSCLRHSLCKGVHASLHEDSRVILCTYLCDPPARTH